MSRFVFNPQTYFSTFSAWINLQHPQFKSYLSGILLLLGASLIIPFGDFRQVNAVPRFWVGIGVMSLGFICSWRLAYLQKWWFWTIVIVTRLLLLFMYPGDEIWRYLWEGYLQTQNFNPYDFAPNANELIPYHTEWWSLIKHKYSAAIYFPLAQLGFNLLATIYLDVITFKIAFVLADLLVCCLLTRKFAQLKTTLYAWNPLVIYAFAGGGYYDSWFILPLVIAWLIFDYTRYAWRWLGSALLLGISLAIKWISLPILGFVAWKAWQKLNLKQVIAILIYGFLPLIFTTVDFCSSSSCSLIPTTSISILSGRSADLLPYILDKIGQPFLKTKSIVMIALGCVGIWLLWKKKTFRQFAEGYLFTLLIFSPLIHSWYFTWIIPFAVPTQNLGVRLVSISAFIYFVLPYRQALGDRNWQLNEVETFWLWFPFVMGYGWSLWRERKKNQV
ncbi:glycosyl transferase, group 2 family protein [Stanieria sp. NIES-3757]|nr:glycosyl transferase, group 2 family protein [Stanieria sp. NIES-3757]